MKFEKIEPYYIEDIDFKFNGAFCFSINNKNLFIEKTGHILITDNYVADCIRNKEISDDVGIKLIQRDFASISENEAFCENIEQKICPTFFMIDLTKKCNMRCKYCLREEYADKEDSSITDEIITEICSYIAKYCREQEVSKIIVQPWGGEPLLERDKIYLIQDLLNKYGIKNDISIETNGTLLNEKILDELYKRKIGISVSIDGYKEIHDAQRVMLNENCSHDLVEKGLLRALKKYHGGVSVIVTLTKLSYGNVEKIIDYLVYDLGLERFKLNYVHKSSFVENDYLCMSSEEIMECSTRILNKIVDLHRKGIKAFDYNLYIKMLNVVSNKVLDACLSRGCCGGRNMITIDMKGNIFPCDVTDYQEEKIGSIYSDKKLVDLIREAIDSKPYFKEKTSDRCVDCPWHWFCRGGCTVHMKCCEYEEVDEIECSVNRVVYPKIIELILAEPEIVNSILENEIL